MCSDLHELIEFVKICGWLYIIWHVVKFFAVSVKAYRVSAKAYRDDLPRRQVAASVDLLEREDLAQREAAVIARLEREGKL